MSADIMTLPGGVMMFAGGFSASRIAAEPSAIARSRSPFARQMTVRLISGDGSAGLSLIASSMSASAPSRSPSACLAAPRFWYENASLGLNLIAWS